MLSAGLFFQFWDFRKELKRSPISVAELQSGDPDGRVFADPPVAAIEDDDFGSGDVRPNSRSSLRFETPSISTSNVRPTSRRLLCSDSSFCRPMISVSRAVFTSSGTSSA